MVYKIKCHDQRSKKSRMLSKFATFCADQLPNYVNLIIEEIKKKLDVWLENKTAQNCETWLKNERTNFFVAESNGRIVGVSSINHDGYIGLCYVLPEVKGHGFGSKLLKAAEASVLNLDVQSFKLESTITAKGFYEHFGYIHMGRSQDRPEYEKATNHNKRMQSDRPSAGR